jgi:hypothetical protein
VPKNLVPLTKRFKEMSKGLDLDFEPLIKNWYLWLTGDCPDSSLAGTIHQECLVSKAVPSGHACGQWAEEILTRQNLIDVKVQERVPVGAPSCCVLIW